MSNVIKAYSVRYDDVAKITIDTHLRIDQEIETKRANTFQVIDSQDGFAPGLNAYMVEEIPDQDTQEKASKIVEDAHAEAKLILEQAKKEAEQIKSNALAAAQKKGYDEGILIANKEAQKLKKEYEDKTRILQMEYDEMIQSLEPQMAEIIAALMQKMTGVVVEDRSEVILYLVEKAMKNMDKSNEYTIRVSSEDYEYLSLKKDSILKAIGREVSLYITEDASLEKNQCLIETELRIVNCSLDVQLNQLIKDLKLIGGI